MAKYLQCRMEEVSVLPSVRESQMFSKGHRKTFVHADPSLSDRFLSVSRVRYKLVNGPGLCRNF
jgi:hypothetical protein